MDIAIIDDSMRDERIDVRLLGLDAHQEVEVRLAACLKLLSRTAEYAAEARFRADASGIVDLSRDEPLSGDYSGADAMGLFWSAKYVADHAADDSFEALISPTMFHLEVREGGRVIGSRSIYRRVIAPSVKYRVVEDPIVRGTLFLPDARYRGGCVVYLEGSGGGQAIREPALLASHGIACLSLPYFNYAGLPDQMVELPVEYLAHAIDWLIRQPEIDEERLGICGISRGGETALLAASLDQRIRSVAAIVPSGILWPSPSSPGFLEDAAMAPWTRGGERLPFHSVSLQWEDQWKMVEAQKEMVATMASTGAWESTPMFIAAMPSNPAACAAHMAVENINGDILLVSAGDDRMWPSMRFCEIVEERLRREGFAHSVEHVSHAGAGHALVAPYVPSVVDFTNAKTGLRTSFGGSDRANATAMESTWNSVTGFFKNRL